LDNKIIFLMLTIIAVWLLINPTTRAGIKAATSKLFSSEVPAAS